MTVGMPERTHRAATSFTTSTSTATWFVTTGRKCILTRPGASLAFGSLEALHQAFSEGQEIKVGIRGLCDDWTEYSSPVPDHTVFVHTGPGYYCTQRKLFCAGSHPVVRVRPCIPMRYASGGWDFGWLMPRSDGFVERWLCDPYTLRFRKLPGRYAIRWFAR